MDNLLARGWENFCSCNPRILVHAVAAALVHNRYKRYKEIDLLVPNQGKL